MRQIQSAARIARQLRTSEVAIDQAILDANALIGTLIATRREERFAAEVGQDALSEVVRSIEALMQARGAMVAGHARLAKIAEDLAVEWRMDGPLDEKIKEMPSFQADERNAA